MQENELKQYQDVKKILDQYKEEDTDIKVEFQSSQTKKYKSFASYRFPKEFFNEELFSTLIKYAELDYEISKRNGEQVGKVTRFNIYDYNHSVLIANYDYEHSLEFLEKMVDMKKTL